MANTPSNAIPFVPENTIDPAAGLNLALDVIDALLNSRVENMTTNTPPGSPADGVMYIVGASPTGAWVGHSKAIARYVADGSFWEFFAAGVQAWLVINKADGKLYIWTVATSTWTVASGAGLTNPMTAKGDLIVGDTGGAPIRLPVGTTGQVLTVAGGTWVAANSAAGFANPMTTAGDVIVGGVAGAAARLGIGADGTVLGVVGGANVYLDPTLIPQNSQSTAYTLVLTDKGKHIYHPVADTTARTFTIPANASVAFPVGTAVTFVNDVGAGAVTIAITTDTMVLAGAGTTGSRTLAAGGIATALKVTSTRWIISGTGLT